MDSNMKRYPRQHGKRTTLKCLAYTVWIGDITHGWEINDIIRLHACQTCTVFKRSNAYSVLAALRESLYSTRVVGCKGRGSHLGCMSSGFEGRRHRFPQISTPHDIQSGRYRFSSMLPTATEKWVVGFARMASAKICGTTGRSALVGAPNRHLTS